MPNFDIIKVHSLSNVIKDNTLLKSVISSLLDKKGFEIRLIEVSEFCSYADFFLVVSATSRTHAQSISDDLGQLSKTKAKPEGYNGGQWILNDLGDILVHVFVNDARDFYQLDKLWAHAPSVSIDEQDQAAEPTRLNTAV